ncbi:MAG: T9SS type A sorting domain-containing protein [Bacteroidota bacterium]
MKKLLLAVVAVIPFSFASAQCTTTNATSCICEDLSGACDLHPDITISWYALENYASGPSEYPQVCTPACGGNDGRLRVTGSTPNIGHGSFTVRGSDYFVCGTDTIYDPTGTQIIGGLCPDGTPARQLIVQRIYQKNGSTMTYYDRYAGAMTYHPTHGHNHVDDWGVFTLRMQDPNDPDPRNWPIVGDGAKLGFCLMDYGQCDDYPGHCRDTNHIYQQGTALTNADFVNWGLGGGAYNCSPVEQGISVGYTDIYSESLDGMWINIPPGTCNGNYWIVAIVDPNNNFLEEDEDNNYTAIPFTLTQQSTSNPVISIKSDIGTTLCSGETALLRATAGTNYSWSTGDTTQTINVSTAGTYTCIVTTYCGTDTASITINTLTTPSAPTTSGDTICSGQSATLTATGTNVRWVTAGGTLLGTGNTFATPALTSTTTYYAQELNTIAGTSDSVGPADNTIGGGGFLNNDAQYLIFDVAQNIILNSVDVYANGAGVRTIQVLDQGGNLVQQGSFNLVNGFNTVNLGFNVPVGIGYQLRVSGTCDMYRNNAGVTYPYVDGTGSVTITTSSAGNAYYYYFYNWKVSVGYSECASSSVPATATVDNCSAVDEVALSEKINVYPNPNSGIFTFTIDVPGTGDFTMNLVNVLGENVFTSSAKNVTGKYSRNIDLSHLSSGVYYLTLKMDGASYAKKIIINK